MKLPIAFSFWLGLAFCCSLFFVETDTGQRLPVLGDANLDGGYKLICIAIVYLMPVAMASFHHAGRMLAQGGYYFWKRKPLIAELRRRKCSPGCPFVDECDAR